MAEPRLRCARCGKDYLEAGNLEGACHYHPGRFCDYDAVGRAGRGAAGDFWNCCMQKVDSGMQPEDLPGCAAGRHVEADPDDPGPSRRDAAAEDESMRRVLPAPTLAARTVFRIRFQGPWGHHKTYAFASGEVTIGRAPECTVSIPDFAFSQRHARVFVSDGGARLSDTKSKSGTQLNGRFVTEEVLRDGDEFRCGGISFGFEVDRVPADEAPELGWSGEGAVAAAWSGGDLILGRYEVLDAFEGGMGLVHRVRDRSWGIDLAVKSPRAEYYRSPTDRTNLFAEAETWIELSRHPHVAPCLFVQTLGGVPRIFAEFMAGGTLADGIASGRLYEGGPPVSLARIRDVLLGSAWGLQHGHDRGVVHQDVKPANILLTSDGMARVSDFGLARARKGAEEARTPPPGQTVWASFRGCTPAYCSPEQKRGEGLSQRTDVWSWALVVLEMFNGERSWMSGAAGAEALGSYVSEGSSRHGAPPMPAGVAEVLASCLVPAGERPPAIAVLAEDAAAAIDAALGVPRRRADRPAAAPATASSMNNEALVWSEMYQWDRAEAAWAEAERLHPGHSETLFNRALTRWRRGLGAEPDVEQAIGGADADEPRRAYLRSLVRLERADAAGALALLEPLVRDRPHDRQAAEARDRALRWSRRPGGFTHQRPGAWQAPLEPARP